MSSSTPAIQLVHPKSSHEVVEVLEGLIEVAKADQLNGLVFGAALRGQKFFVDAAGSLHRNPVVGIGVAAMLLAELEHRIRRQETDTLM